VTFASGYGDGVPLAAAAVCPHPPLLIPRFAGEAAAELDRLRAACRAAVALLLGAAPEEFVVVAAGPATASYPGGTTGSLGPWGVPVPVTLGAPNGARPVADLPLGIAVGAWLLGTLPRPVHGQSVAEDLDPAGCAALGRRLVDGPRRVGLLVMADGSACRSEKAPGYLDPRAEPFDAAVAAALAGGDAGALLAIDPGLAAELRCAGRAPWQVLAGAADSSRSARLLYDEAPYGVGYLVASWS
jgi:hypothetical protein